MPKCADVASSWANTVPPQRATARIPACASVPLPVRTTASARGPHVTASQFEDRLHCLHRFARRRARLELALARAARLEQLVVDDALDLAPLGVLLERATLVQYVVVQ